MTTERGREVVRKLVPLCDMVMENMRAPVVRKWGFERKQRINIQVELC